MEQVNRTVKIPECMNPFYVEVNGHAYSYPAGTTQEVPEAVAAVIEAHEKNHPAGYHGPVHNQSLNIRPDWNVNDPMDLRYVRNKPFGETTEVLLEETYEHGSTPAKALKGYADIKVGDTVKVTYDGAEYLLEAYERSNGCAVGNKAITFKGGEDTGEPFAVFCFYSSGVSQIKVSAEGLHKTHTLKIEKLVVHKLDPKFLPGGGGGGGSGGGGTGGADLLDENGIIKQAYLPDGFPYKSGKENSVILPSTTLALSEEGYFIIPEALEFADGQEYVVKFENLGLEYATVCREPGGGEFDGAKWVLGDPGLLDGKATTGEPFVMIIPTPELAAEVGVSGMLMYFGDATTLTVSITGFAGVFNRIDESYLPERESDTVVVSAVGSYGKGFEKCSHTYEQIDALVRQGKNVVLDVQPSEHNNSRDRYHLISWGFTSVAFSRVDASGEEAIDAEKIDIYSDRVTWVYRRIAVMQ